MRGKARIKRAQVRFDFDWKAGLGLLGFVVLLKVNIPAACLKFGEPEIAGHGFYDAKRLKLGDCVAQAALYLGDIGCRAASKPDFLVGEYVEVEREPGAHIEALVEEAEHAFSHPGLEAVVDAKIERLEVSGPEVAKDDLPGWISSCGDWGNERFSIP
ncbi:MAG TPA: hypothetical protein VMN36_14520 [Verrucomicrobiales bacterium]|nr:hypothetical protein [Verrucomicrobiales bacterium]